VIHDAIAELAVPIKTLRPYKGNPRVGDIATIRESLERNGQYRPIVVRRATNEVLAGNHTLLAARELGWQEIAATFVDVDAEQARRIVLVDNRANDRAGYDDEALAKLLQAIQDLAGTGWTSGELDRLLDSLARSGEDAARDTEPMALPAKPTARRGDVWQLGGHRLICGDSTDADDVARLFGDELAEMVWTDPPYGVDYHDRRGGKRIGYSGKGGVGARLSREGGAGERNSKGGRVGAPATFGRAGSGTGAGFANDHTDPELLYALVKGALGLALEHTRKGGAVYVAHPDGRAPVFRRAVDDAGWEIHQTLVWVKQVFVLTRQDYHWQHEPILYGWRPGAGHRWNGSLGEPTTIDDEQDPRQLDKRELLALVRRLRNERNTDVVRADRPMVAELHPTSKPVELVAHMVQNSSRRGELVYEPFGGSGTTMIAADNLGRRAYLVEYEPRYCDVIVDRWQRHTGEVAELERKRSRTRAAV
jgi:site-specific DNA-methyltransferase (adenine-specific)